jgi:hypothetical protein
VPKTLIDVYDYRVMYIYSLITLLNNMRFILGKFPGILPLMGKFPGILPKINGLHDYAISNSDYVTVVIFFGAPIAINTMPQNTMAWVFEVFRHCFSKYYFICKTDDVIYRS